MNWISLLPQLISAAIEVQSWFNTTPTNSSFGRKLATLAPEIGGLLTDLGSQLFPKAAPALHAIGGAIAAFNPDYTKWLQGSLNTLSPSLGLPDPHLAVDGVYGPMTRAAVEAVQAHFGIVVDGLAGNVTQGWIAKALAALPQIP